MDPLVALDALAHVGQGVEDLCGFGTPDGPCPNAAVTSVAAAAAHPHDGRARWLVPAWTPACRWHRDALDEAVDGTPVAELWSARGGAAEDHAAITDPTRHGLRRWLEATPDARWWAELGLEPEAG